MGKRKLVYHYIASPYSDPLRHVKDSRYNLVCWLCSEYARKGIHVYSPIAHWHPIAVKYGLPGDYDFWKSMDKIFLKYAASLIVFKLLGWDCSIGVKAEMEYAKELGKPITFEEPPYAQFNGTLER